MVDRAPKVSLGLPVYNAEKYLTHALNGLLEQDYEDFELIISDNSSTDGTSEICKEYARTDRRIRYFRNNRNMGWQQIIIVHSSLHGDSSSSGLRMMMISRKRCFFASCEHWKKHHPMCALAYSFCEYVDEDGKIENMDSDRDRPAQSVASQPARARVEKHPHVQFDLLGLVRSDVLRQTHLHGLFPGSDHVLLSRISDAGYICGNTRTAVAHSKTCRSVVHEAQGTGGTARIVQPGRERIILYFGSVGPREPGTHQIGSFDTERGQGQDIMYGGSGVISTLLRS